MSNVRTGVVVSTYVWSAAGPQRTKRRVQRRQGSTAGRHAPVSGGPSVWTSLSSVGGAHGLSDPYRLDRSSISLRPWNESIKFIQYKFYTKIILLIIITYKPTGKIRHFLEIWNLMMCKTNNNSPNQSTK